MHVLECQSIMCLNPAGGIADSWNQLFRSAIKDQPIRVKKMSEVFRDQTVFSKFQDKVDWVLISIYQKLSEKFIEKFIEKFQDKVDWHSISRYQKLSEKFIEKFQYKVSWYSISRYQKLSEKFIEKFKNNIYIIIDNWLYASKEEKINYIKEKTDYKVYDDDYIIAYKSIRSNNYSVYNFQYLYKVGKIYESHCDCNLDNENSFGLSAWTKEEALGYFNRGKLLKVKIKVEDIGAIVHSGNKIRCFRFEVLEEVKQ